MEATTPVTIPLPIDVSRCLGHDGRLGNGCGKRDYCARHISISHINEPWDITKPPYYRMCADETFGCFMGVDE